MYFFVLVPFYWAYAYSAGYRVAQYAGSNLHKKVVSDSAYGELGH